MQILLLHMHTHTRTHAHTHTHTILRFYLDKYTEMHGNTLTVWRTFLSIYLCKSQPWLSLYPRVHLPSHKYTSLPTTGNCCICSLDLVAMEIRLHGGVVTDEFDETVTHVVFDKRSVICSL